MEKQTLTYLRCKNIKCHYNSTSRQVFGSEFYPNDECMRKTTLIDKHGKCTDKK